MSVGSIIHLCDELSSILTSNNSSVNWSRLFGQGRGLHVVSTGGGVA